MMQFRLISDVHNEFYNPIAMTTGLERMVGDEDRVLVIAGDFHTLKNGKNSRDVLRTFSERFKAVIYVPGNHEYYGYRIDEKAARKKFQTEMNPDNLPNIHFLIRESVVIDGVRFVGATLWTNLDKGHPVVEFEIAQKMNDFRFITYFDEKYGTYRKFKTRDWITEHHKDLSYIKSAVEASEEPVVVVTHHAPTAESLDPRFEWDIYGNFGYHSDLSDFILDHTNIRYWCHGHIHTRSDYVVGETIVACNPYGYPEEDVDFMEKFFYQVY